MCSSNLATAANKKPAERSKTPVRTMEKATKVAAGKDTHKGQEVERSKTPVRFHKKENVKENSKENTKDNNQAHTTTNANKKHSVFLAKKTEPNTTTNANNERKGSVFAVKKEVNKVEKKKSVSKDDSTIDNKHTTAEKNLPVKRASVAAEKRNSLVNAGGNNRKGSVTKTDGKRNSTSSNVKGNYHTTTNVEKNEKLEVETEVAVENEKKDEEKAEDNKICTDKVEVTEKENNKVVETDKTEVENKINNNTETGNTSNPKSDFKSFKPKSQPPEDISSNTLKALYIAVNSNYVPNKLKFQIATAIPVIKSNFDLKSLIKSKIANLNSKLSEIEQENSKYFTDTSVQSLIYKTFTPGKTAQSGLAFVTKEEENNLCKKDQPEEILNVFRIIYLIIGEDIESVPSNKLIDNLINVVMPRIGVDALSKQLYVII